MTQTFLPEQRVTVADRFGLDKDFTGLDGTFLEITPGTGFARVRLDYAHPAALADRIVLVHPESLEAADPAASQPRGLHDHQDQA